MMLKKIYVLGCLFAIQTVCGQLPNYTLEDCIAIALKNNNDVKRAKLNNNRSEIQFKQAKNSMLPTLNGSYDYGFTSGRSIDPATNDYINRELQSSSANLSLGLTVFNGFKILNTMKQNRLSLQASEMEITAAKQNLILNVTLGYLRVLNAKDLLNQSKNNIENTKKQLVRLQKNNNEGAINPADFADIKGQYAFEQTQIVNAENSLKESELQLMTLLNTDTDFTIQTLSSLNTINQYKKTLEDVYQEALANFPSVKAATLKVESSKKSVQIAKASYLPSLSLFAQTGTNYSSAGSTFVNTGNTIVENGDFVTVNSVDYPVFSNQSTFKEQSISYQNQFENNLNTIIGLQLNIPIFNGFRAKNEVALEKINLSEAALDLQENQLVLKQAIKQAYNDMESAYKRQEILKEQVKAYKESFRVNEIRYNNGVANFLAYITSKNNYNSAKINLANATYDYVLRVRILEYYSSAAQS